MHGAKLLRRLQCPVVEGEAAAAVGDVGADEIARYGECPEGSELIEQPRDLVPRHVKTRARATNSGWRKLDNPGYCGFQQVRIDGERLDRGVDGDRRDHGGG